MARISRQNDLLLNKLSEFYQKNNFENMDKVLKILNGEATVSLRIVDWFVTNYSKQKYVVYDLSDGTRFKVYTDYKLKLKAYSKKRFDPFCRWDRISVPYKDGQFIQTTIGQLNFFKWVMDNEIMNYIEQNYANIEHDMNNRNSTAKNGLATDNKTRKKREELSISAAKSIKKEFVEIVVSFE